MSPSRGRAVSLGSWERAAERLGVCKSTRALCESPGSLGPSAQR